MSDSLTGMPIDGHTIPHAFLRRLKLTPEATAYKVKRKGSYQPILWKEVGETVNGLSAYLRGLGLKTGDKVAIVSHTRAEWTMADLAIQCSGFVTVPVYPSCNAEDTQYVIEHCEAKAVIAEDAEQYTKLLEAFKTITPVPVVLIQQDGQEGTVSFEEASKTTPDAEEMEKISTSLKSEDLATIVYTSGTTGQPKGVELTHDNILSELRAVIQEVDFTANDTCLTFLPFAHILARLESLIPVLAGNNLAFAESIETLAKNMTEAHPTILVSVPRIYEKVYAKIQTGVENGPPLKKKMFEWATVVGREVARLRSDGRPLPLTLAAKYKVADRLVFSKVRERMGGRIRFTISGGAPLSAELCEFFHACGIKILEGYGLTETTAAITCNHPNAYQFGSVGQPLSGVELRIAEDGEILARGPQVFKRYHKNEEATLEVFSGDWFHTGDIGEIDDRGYLRITDRKKELIVTAGGKNIAPQKIENMMKQIRFVSNAMVYGDKQKFLVALVAANMDALQDWAKESGLEGDTAQLVQHESVFTLMEKEIKGMNVRLASYETIKKFRIVPEDFTVEKGELTPSLKLKRKNIKERYQDLLKEMYGATTL